MTVTVYSRPACTQCDASYRALLGAGIDISVVSVENNAEALAMIKGLGYLQAPVVVTDDAHWSGFRPDKIDELKASLTAQGIALEPRDRGTVSAMIKQIKADMLENAMVAA